MKNQRIYLCLAHMSGNEIHSRGVRCQLGCSSQTECKRSVVIFIQNRLVFAEWSLCERRRCQIYCGADEIAL